jgi:hypothetical protein
MLKITDLTTSKEMGTKEMSGVRGGFDPFAFLATTTSTNKVSDVDPVTETKVADVTRAFNFQFAQVDMKGRRIS